MRRFFLVVSWLTVLVTLAFVSLTKYEVTEHLEASATGNIETEGISRLWFSPGGELVGVGGNESQLIVRVWSGGTSHLSRERTVSLPAATGAPKPIFAVSADAGKAAWITPAGVHVESLISPPPENSDTLGFKRKIAISALAFTGLGQLAALYRDGELEFWDLAGERVAASKHIDIAEPVSLLANGQYMAAYSSASGDAFVFDTGAGDRLSLIEYKNYPRDCLSFTLSPEARFAVGTRQTLEAEGHSLAAPGPVRTLAYYDRNRILVGGDFSGIYMLGPGQDPQQVAVANPGTTVLAAAGSKLVFGDSRLLALASNRLVRNRVYKGMSRPSPWAMLALFALISPVAIYFFYVWVRLLLKKTSMQSPEKHEPGKEGPVPSVLVAACQNGDCVLWAGSGLGAQAGLPAWSAFLRELLEWAAKSEPALAEWPDGKTDAAADRIAAAFENREQALQAYLRQRFRVGSELPQAHQLIKQIDFPALISTNLDNLLDRAFPQSGGRVHTAAKCGDLRHAAAHRDFVLLKPFGDLDEPDTIRLGPSQCAEAIHNNPSIREFVEGVFETRVFLFLGASLEGIESDLGLMAPLAAATRKHYALVPVIGEGWVATAQRLRQRYGIEPLTYSPSTDRHPEVVDFLAKLIETIRQKSYTQEYVAGE